LINAIIILAVGGISMSRKFLIIIKHVCIIIFTFVFFILISLISTFFMFTHGPSPSAKKLFVTTFLETGQMKFVVNLFMTKKDIQNVVNSNSMKVMNTNVDSSYINTHQQVKNNISIEEVSGETYTGTMMIISNPSKVFVGTPIPFTAAGKELDKIVVDNDAIGGINGGLYSKSGWPAGPVISKGKLVYNDKLYFPGLVLIAFDENNILQTYDLDGMDATAVENLVKTKKIRDGVCFQEEASDKNNHFVKLIINGQARELNGTGSGANPRTVIGQKQDGTVLFFVTDGRGINGDLGATASDLIAVMQKYGAVNAANLDGGSSSVMYYNGKYLRTSVTLYKSNSSWEIPEAFLVSGDNNEKK
jgi:exopolysaccharide biosynthesis protein